MSTGLGINIDQNGNGTTPDDMMRIIGAEWRMEGIISGIAVSPQNDWSYKVFPGAVVMAFGSEQDMKTKVPVAMTMVPTEPAGKSHRTDIVYVQQRTVSADGDNLAVVKVGPKLPPRAILLAEFDVPPNAKSTKDCTRKDNRVNARPVGGSFGQLTHSTDTDTSVHTTGVFKRGAGRLVFGGVWAGVSPTDRDVMVHMSSTVSAGDAGNGYTKDEEGSVVYKFYVNGELVKSWERGYNNVWETKHFCFPLVLQTSVIDVYYTVERRWYREGHSGTWQVRHGGAANFPGDQFWVMDHGVANL